MYEQISRLQFFFLMYWLVIGTGIYLLPLTIGQFVIHDSWMVGPVFILGAIALSAVVHVFVRVFPGQNLIDALQTAFGSWLGRMLGGWMLIWMFVNNCLILRQMTLFVTTNIFPNTPVYVATAIFMAPLIYAVFKGVEIVGRLAEIISPWAIATTIVLYLLALPNARFTNVLPLLADGFSPVLRGSLVPWMFSTNFIIALLMVRNLKDPRKMGKDVLISGIAAGSTGLFAESVTTMVVGQIRSSTLFPVLEVIRTIRLGYFLERLDPLYVITVITTIFLNAAALFYTMLVAVQSLFGCKSYRPFVWGGALAVWSGTFFLMKNSGRMLDFVIHAAPGYYFVTAVGIPVLAIVVQLVKRRLTRNRPQGSQPTGGGRASAAKP
jgi:spore germination protein (amino acid permease)